MSKARKINKFNRVWWVSMPPYPVTGHGAEQTARWHKKMDKVDFGPGYGSLDPVDGIKYAVPHGQYVQYKGRKQLPRLYYAKRR